MNRRWLYPYYVIIVLLLLMWLTGCDGGGENRAGDSFSVDVRVENKDGTPVEGAKVGVQPCYTGLSVCEEKDSVSSAQSRATTQSATVTAWTVQREKQEVLLTWKTTREQDNAGFRIERKTDRQDEFEQVDFVDGQGSTEATTPYRYVDVPSRWSSELTYRLVAVSVDGDQSVVGPPRIVQAPPPEPEVLDTSPNPFRSRFVLRLAVGTTSTVASSVHRLNGRKVHSFFTNETLDRGRHQFLLDVPSNLPAGLYELRTTIRYTAERAIRDTSYIIRLSGRAFSNIAGLGSTNADGTVATTKKGLFPSLFDPPSIPIRNEEGLRLGEVEVHSAFQLVVITDDGRRQTFRRTVSEGENTLTLTIAP